MARLVFDLLEERRLGVLRRHGGDARQFVLLLLLQVPDFLQMPLGRALLDGQRFPLGVQGAEFFVECFLFLCQFSL